MLNVVVVICDFVQYEYNDVTIYAIYFVTSNAIYAFCRRYIMLMESYKIDIIVVMIMVLFAYHFGRLFVIVIVFTIFVFCVVVAHARYTYICVCQLLRIYCIVFVCLLIQCVNANPLLS